MGTGQAPKARRGAQSSTEPRRDGLRPLFGWTVTLSDEKGATHDLEVWNYWSPDAENASDEISKAAAATATAEARELRIPIGCVRIGA